MRKKIGVIVLLLMVLNSGCSRQVPAYMEEVFTTEEGGNESTEESVKESTAERRWEESAGEGTEAKDGICYVYVCGEVKMPGVYELPAGSRVYTAIELAGGLTSKAEASAVNQALPIEDGQMIYVPLLGEEAAGALAESGQQNPQTYDGDGKIDLNKADLQDLMEIPGIGEAKAKSIVAYRQEHGNFLSIEDVMKITGIKEGLYEKMKDYITVSQ